MTRQAILARVRAGLAIDAEQDAERARAVAERLTHPPAHPQPACAKVQPDGHRAQFILCLESQGAEVIEIDGLAVLPAAVEALLGRTGASAYSSSPRVGEDRGGGESRTPTEVSPPTPSPSPQGGRLLLGDDARLTTLAWPAGLTPRRWNADTPIADGDAALTHAFAAVAETGTLVLTSSAASPATLAFLPELHLVAVAGDTIVASFEEAFASLAAIGAPRLPRAVNLVSGPSRTGDIGGRIVKGAHGPRRLVVLIY